MHPDDVAGNEPGGYCSPRCRTPFDSIIEGSNCISVTRRAISGRPYTVVIATIVDMPVSTTHCQARP
jgi:hypothetical protein